MARQKKVTLDQFFNDAQAISNELAPGKYSRIDVSFKKETDENIIETYCTIVLETEKYTSDKLFDSDFRIFTHGETPAKTLSNLRIKLGEQQAASILPTLTL